MHLNPIHSKIYYLTLWHELAICYTNPPLVNHVSCIGIHKGVADALKIRSVQVYIVEGGPGPHTRREIWRAVLYDVFGWISRPIFCEVQRLIAFMADAEEKHMAAQIVDSGKW